MEKVQARHRQHTMTCFPLKVCYCNLVFKYCKRFSQTSKYSSAKEVRLTSPFNQLVFFHSLLMFLDPLLCRNAIPLIGFCVLGSPGRREKGVFQPVKTDDLRVLLPASCSNWAASVDVFR